MTLTKRVGKPADWEEGDPEPEAPLYLPWCFVVHQVMELKKVLVSSHKIASLLRGHSWSYSEPVRVANTVISEALVWLDGWLERGYLRSDPNS